MRSGRCGQHMFVSGPRPLAHARRGRSSPSARAPIDQHLAALRRAEAGVDAAALQLPGRAQAVERVRARLHPGHRLPPARGAPTVRATLIWCPARAAGAAWHAADRRVRRARLPRCSRVRLQRRAQAGRVAELALTVKTARKPCSLAHGDARRKGGRACLGLFGKATVYRTETAPPVWSLMLLTHSKSTSVLRETDAR